LKAFIEEQPHVYRDEMIDFIIDEYDISVSLTTMSTLLQKEKISLKKSVFASFLFYLILLILATKNSKRAISIPSI